MFSPDDICFISQDNYYFPREQQPKDKNNVTNFDLPESIDFESYIKDINQLKAGQTVERKEYTFNNEKAIPKDLVDENLIRKHQTLPLLKRGTRLFVALSDPTNLQALDEIKFNTGLNTEAVVTDESKLLALIEQFLVHLRFYLTSIIKMHGRGTGGGICRPIGKPCSVWITSPCEIDPGTAYFISQHMGFFSSPGHIFTVPISSGVSFDDASASFEDT